MNKKDMFIREKLQQDKIISDRANKIFDNIKEEFKVENNEKKVIKISLGTFIAIAASLVIVGFVGINLYANSLGKPNIISGIQALLKNEPEVNVDEIAKELFEKGAYEIRKLEYSSFVKDEYQVEGEFIEKEINGRLYVKTNEKFETIEQKYAEIFTDDALKNVLSRRFANVDGVLYVSHGGATGWDITNVEVEEINEENGELTYRASYNDVNIDDSISEEKYTCEFKIKEVNGEYRISATNYCNLDKKQENEEEKENLANNYLDNETARTIIQSYLNIVGAKAGSPEAVLGIEEIGLIDRNSEIPGGDNVDKEGYRSSNINYEDFKNKMLQYMTEELFNEFFGYKNVGGKLYVFDGGATGIWFDIKEISLISSNENTCKYTIRAIEYPPEEGMNCVGEVELQKNKDGKYVVSALGWTLVEEPENNDIDSNEVVGIVSGVDAMPEMLKYRNEEYRANYYYRLAGLRSNGDGTYTATVDFYSPIFISEEKYKNIVDNGWGEVEGDSYTFSSKNNESNVGYGYIYNENINYTIEKQDRGYAFYREIGGVVRIIETLASSFEMTLSEDTVINQTPNGGKYTLKEYANTLTNDFITRNMITFEYSEQDGNIYLLRDAR